MKHGRASQNGATHALSTAIDTTGHVPLRRYGAVCGTNFTSFDDDGRPNSWINTTEPVTCARCLTRLEKLAEQALYDQAAINAMTGVTARPNAEQVRAFRRAWPAMGRAVADLLRHRGVKLGEGWLGPARVTERIEQ